MTSGSWALNVLKFKEELMMFELIIVGIMFAMIVATGAFGTAYILSEAYNIFEEFRRIKK